MIYSYIRSVCLYVRQGHSLVHGMKNRPISYYLTLSQYKKYFYFEPISQVNKDIDEIRSQLRNLSKI